MFEDRLILSVLELESGLSVIPLSVRASSDVPFSVDVLSH